MADARRYYHVRPENRVDPRFHGYVVAGVMIFYDLCAAIYAHYLTLEETQPTEERALERAKCEASL